MPDRGFYHHTGCRSGFEPMLAEMRKEFQHMKEEGSCI
jgi:hypothetical protein